MGIMETVRETKTITLNEFEAIKGPLRVDDTPESIIVGNHFYEMDAKSCSLPRSGSQTPIHASAYINDTMGDVYIPNATDVKVYTMNPHLPVVNLLGGYSKALWNYGTAITDDHWEESDINLLLQESDNAGDHNTANKLRTFAHAKVMESLGTFSTAQQVYSAGYFAENDAKYTPWAMTALHQIAIGNTSRRSGVYDAHLGGEAAELVFKYGNEQQVLRLLNDIIKILKKGYSPSEREHIDYVELAEYLFATVHPERHKIALDALIQYTQIEDVHKFDWINYIEAVDLIVVHGDTEQAKVTLDAMVKTLQNDKVGYDYLVGQWFIKNKNGYFGLLGAEKAAMVLDAMVKIAQAAELTDLLFEEARTIFNNSGAKNQEVAMDIMVKITQYSHDHYYVYTASSFVFEQGDPNRKKKALDTVVQLVQHDRVTILSSYHDKEYFFHLLKFAFENGNAEQREIALDAMVKNIGEMNKNFVHLPTVEIVVKNGDTEQREIALDTMFQIIQEIDFARYRGLETNDAAKIVIENGNAEQREIALDAMVKITQYEIIRLNKEQYYKFRTNGLHNGNWDQLVTKYGDANHNYQVLQVLLLGRHADSSYVALGYLNQISNPQIAVEVAQKYLDSTWLGDDAVEEFIQSKRVDCTKGEYTFR